MFVLFVMKQIFQGSIFSELDFFSRSQTWIPITTLIIGAGIGFINDFYDVARTGAGLRLSHRIIIISLLAGAIAWWFYDKLEITGINIPF